MADFSVVAKLMADSSAFTSGINDAKGAIESLPKSTSQAMSQIGSAMQSVGAGMTTFITAPVVAGVATAIKSYADLEQAIGGIETLFKGSASAVISNSETAYKRAGVSGVDYMEQVTSFSATLLQGLGGDTVKAAEYADKAIVDMSDNANKFGTNIGDIQNAYQGFAKDNYSMLDNLKLGYGGTASEMARLVNESGVLNGEFEATAENVKDIPFDVLIEAIHQTQKEMDVTGTTALEASETVSGSFDSMIASAQNLVAGFGHADADIGQLMANLGETVEIFVGNIKRVLGTMWDNLPLEEWQKWVGLIVVAAGPILVALGTIIKVVASAGNTFKALGGALKFVLSPASLLTGALLALIGVFAYLMVTNEHFRDSVISSWQSIQESAIRIFGQIKDFVMDFFEAFSNTKAFQALGAMLISVGNAIKAVFSSLSGVFGDVGINASDLGTSFGKLVENVANAINRVADFITALNPSTIRTYVTAIVSAVAGFKLLKGAMNLKGVFSKLFSGFGKSKKGMGEMTTSFTKGRGIIERVFDGIVKVITSSAKGIGTILTNLGTSISTIFKGLGEGIATASKGIGAGIGTIFKSIGQMTRVMNPVSMLAFAGAIALVVASLALLATQSEGVAQILQALGDAIGTIVLALGEGLATMFEGIGNALATLADSLGTAIATIVTALTPIVEIIGTTFTTIASIIAGAIVQIVQALAPFIPAITEMVGVVVTNLPLIIGAFALLVSQLGSAIGEIIRSFGQFAVSVGTAIAIVVSSVSTGVANIITAFVPLVEQIGETISTVIEAIGTFAESIGTALATVVSAVSTGVADIINAFSGLVDSLSGVFDSIGGVIESIGNAISGVIDSIGDSAVKIGESLKLIAEGAQELSNVDMGGLAGNMFTLAGGLGALSILSLDDIGAGLTSIGTALSGIYNVSALAGDFEAFKSSMTGLGDVSTSAGTGLATLPAPISGIYNVSALATDFTALKTALNGLGAIATSAGTGLSSLGTTMSTVSSSVSTGATSMVNTVKSSLDNINSTTKSVTNSVKSTTQSTLSAVQSNVTQTMSTITNQVSSATSSIRSTWTSGMMSFTSMTTTSMNSATSTIRSAMSNSVSAMRSASGQARSAGANMGYGFQSGLASTAGSIYATARNIANNAARIMRSALRIKSPSRVTEEIGSFTGEGFVNGLENMIRPASKAAKSLALSGVPDIDSNSITGELNRLTGGNLNAGYTFNGGTLSINQQPATIHLNMGGHEWSAFTSDISQTQQAELRLENY